MVARVLKFVSFKLVSYAMIICKLPCAVIHEANFACGAALCTVDPFAAVFFMVTIVVKFVLFKLVSYAMIICKLPCARIHEAN